MKVRPYRFLARAVLAAAFAWAASPAVAAEPPVLTVEQLFAPEPLIGRLPASIVWSPDGNRFLYTLPGGRSNVPVDMHVYDLRTKHDRIFFQAQANGKGARPTPEFVWSPDSRQLAYLDRGDLYVVAADGTGRRKLAGGADDPQWSPDSRRIGYVHANDVYAIAVSGGTPWRYSRDGSDDTVNGDPDWVYSEELGMRHAFRWAPDGRRIAYLHFDDRPVTKFPIVDFLPVDNTVAYQRYPEAGEANPVVALRVAEPDGASRTLYSTKAADDYIASVGWTPRGLPAAQLLDRAQKRWRYVAFAGRARETLVTETSRTFVDVPAAPVWFAHGERFLFVGQRDGEDALYRVDAHTGAVVRLTHGYHVFSLAGVDEKLGIAYVQAAYPTRRRSTLLAIPLRPGLPRALASGPGSHTFILAPDARRFIRIDSDFSTPPVYRTGSTLGGEPVVFAQAKSLAANSFAKPQLFQIDSVLGKLDAWMIVPPGFDPAKQYPVITYVYGGPAASTTQDVWGGDYLWSELLAQHGFIVFSVDGPGSQIDERRGVDHLYHNLGPGSLAGQLAGATYLKTLPYVDPARLGIWGWSFGGYETAYALTHAPAVWKTGVAVAPVTDWRFYDSIYTERYMGTPRHEAASYTASSVLPQARQLRGRLLVSHGTGDDNVHLANTIALAQAVVLAGKQMDLMVYPRKTHGISGIVQRRQLFNHMLHYWEDHL
ncbi:MAG: DPP IV N-terminal domain-containing protein [Candidatus Velthaea sp.]